MPTEERHLERNDLATENTVARFEVWPHRSLDARGTRILLACSAVAGLVAVASNPGSHTLAIMAGPLAMVGALAVAFWCNNWAAARRHESIEVAPDTVRITRRRGKGALATVEFSTGWVRLAVTQERVAANRIAFRQSDRSCSVGECLSPEERATLAQALEAAILDVRSRRKPDIIAPLGGR
jgi:uncharacterized membrane protein